MIGSHLLRTSAWRSRGVPALIVGLLVGVAGSGLLRALAGEARGAVAAGRGMPENRSEPHECEHGPPRGAFSRVWEPETSRDPFRFAAAAVATQADRSGDRSAREREARALFQVNAVMLGPVPRALINGRVYEVGQVVAGYRITRIEHRRVVVEREGWSILLDL